MTQNKKIIYVILVATISFVIGYYLLTNDHIEYEETVADKEDCNVLAFSVNGYLSTYMPVQSAEQEFDISSSEDVVDGILLAKDDPKIKAVILSIDSGGGDGVAGEEIVRALKVLEKPSVAVLRSIGASSAYWAATGADKIFASRISDVGGIGVTASYLDESIKNTRDGYTYVELSSAQYKDVGDTSRPLSAQEKILVMEDIRKMHDVFVQDVALNRNMKVEDVAKLANGLTYMGSDAIQNGLIDEIGDIITATKYIEEQIGEKAEFCWY